MRRIAFFIRFYTESCFMFGHDWYILDCSLGKYLQKCLKNYRKMKKCWAPRTEAVFNKIDFGFHQWNSNHFRLPFMLSKKRIYLIYENGLINIIHWCVIRNISNIKSAVSTVYTIAYLFCFPWTLEFDWRPIKPAVKPSLSKNHFSNAEVYTAIVLYVVVK